MAQRLKRWESPRRKGRNHKGRGGSARHRQIVKQQQLWRKRLRSKDQADKSSKTGETCCLSCFFCTIEGVVVPKPVEPPIACCAKIR
ncbi:MAG: hypothetical protein AAF152_18745 [Cyanobacteria bacterium P01_A01_bin.114]